MIRVKSSWSKNMLKQIVLGIALLSLPSACTATKPQRSAIKSGSAKKIQSPPAVPKKVVKTPILARGLIYRIDPAQDRDNGYTCMLQVADMVRGSLEIHERQFYVTIRSPKRSFPWIKNREYEGSSIHLHMRRKRGAIVLEGISKDETGATSPLY
jgi:hypothetical protein